MKKLILLIYSFLLFLPSIGMGQYLNLSNDKGTSTEPQIIAGADGNINVIWMDNANGNWEIFYAVYNNSTWSPIYNISSTPTNSMHPRMAVDSGGWVNAVWEEDTPGKKDIMSARFNPFQQMIIYKDTLTVQIDSSSISPDVAVINDVPVVCWLTDSGNSFAKLYCARYDTLQQRWSVPVMLDDSASFYQASCRITPGNNGTIIYIAGRRYITGGLDYFMGVSSSCKEHGTINGSLYGEQIMSSPDFEVLTKESNSVVRKNHCGLEVKYDSLILIYHDSPCTCMWDSPVECIEFDGSTWNNSNFVIVPKMEEGDYSKISFTFYGGNKIIMGCNRQDSMRTSIRTKIYNDSSWQSFDFLPNNNFTDLSLTSTKYGEIWAAMCSDTSGGANFNIIIYHSKITSISNKDVSVMPVKIQLFQNYPNPFNPSTTIKYQIPKESSITIKIFDMLGREVTTLLNAEQKAGEHEVVWDAKDFASGVYIYQIKAGDFSATRKMFLVK